MKENNYAVIRESFLCSYKSFVDFISLTIKNQSMYNILVLRKPYGNGLVNISVVIRNCNNDERMFNEYYNNVVLNYAESNVLITKIRNDFKDNHEIFYAVINPENFIQTLQNANFSLNIKLNSIEEFEDAIDFNSKINFSSNKSKVLSRI